MAISVNDGTAKWSIESIYNAGQLNGLTAEQIKGQVSVPVKGVVWVYGYFNVGATSANGFVGATCPVPSGYDRNKCLFFAEGSYEFSNRGVFSTSFIDINQKKGVFPANSGIFGSGTASIPYLLWAWK